MSRFTFKWRTPSLVAAAMVAGAALAAGTLSLAPAAGQAVDGAAVHALQTSFADVVEKTAPAVVFIEVEREPTGTPAGRFRSPRELGPDFDPFEFFFGPGRGTSPFDMPLPRRGMPVRGQGTGFIISPDGYIVTNNHVVGDMDRVRVTLADGRRFDAVTVGTDPQTEIALIKIDGEDLPTVKLADSDKLRVGDWVLAIGNPFGLNHTVTSGIVSARGRGNVNIVDYADFIQTDAAINPGNSGGPLLNLNGEVVGMNTAILSPSGSNAGIGFAVPANMIRYVVDELREHGTVTRGYLGINIQALTPDLARWFGVDENRGVVVADVTPDSPADKAGLKRDDVIVELNGEPVGALGSFRSHIAATAPGSTLTLTVVRDGKRIEKKVETGALPGSERVASAGGSSGPGQPSGGAQLGVTVQPLTDELAQRFDYVGRTGLVVADVQPGSPAARAGIRPGDLIEEVNRRPVANAEDLRVALDDNKGNNTALLRVRSADGARYVPIELT